MLIASAFDFTASSLEPPRGKHDTPHVILPDGEVRHGNPASPPDVRMLVGCCAFVSPDVSLLVSLLPRLVHARGEPRLAMLMHLVNDEARTRRPRPARDVIFARLVVLLIEALRSTAGTTASPGLLRGLADERLAVAIRHRQMHQDPTGRGRSRSWPKAAALSRSAFFDRFSRAVGVARCRTCSAGGWRGKRSAASQDVTVREVAERVGYASASTFSVAFTRHAGQPPTHYRDDRQTPTRSATK